MKYLLTFLLVGASLNSEETANILNPSEGVYHLRDNREIVTSFYKALGENDHKALEELLSKSYTVVDASASYQTDFSKFDSMSKKLLVRQKALHSAFPDLKVKPGPMIAEGNNIFTRVTLTGIQKGEFLGVKPTNKPVTIKMYATFTIEDGLISEINEMWNELNVMKQIGYIVL